MWQMSCRQLASACHSRVCARLHLLRVSCCMQPGVGSQSRNAVLAVDVTEYSVMHQEPEPILFLSFFSFLSLSHCNFCCMFHIAWNCQGLV